MSNDNYTNDNYTIGDIFNAMRDKRKRLRKEHGIQCPQCKIVRPKAHPSILLPQQRCKVDGYKDHRPRIKEETI